MMAYRKILVTGCRGQLGRDLIRMLENSFQVSGIDIEDIDILDSRRLETFILKAAPDVVIHTAAYTDVDGCESNPELAMAVNCAGAENVARACRAAKAKMILYSTDYVFDGFSATPYAEDDIPAPQTIYGKSKWEGERAVSRTIENNAILRIAWVYGYHGKNFVKTMMKLGKKQIHARKNGENPPPLKIVDDQFGNPTWTEDVVRQTQIVLEKDLTGVYHASSEGTVSWYQFASDIFRLLNMPVRLAPCSTEEYPRPAPRPRYSSLENAALKKLGLNLMPHYDKSLENFLNSYGARLLNEITD